MSKGRMGRPKGTMKSHNTCFACGSRIPEDFDFKKFMDDKLAKQELFLKRAELIWTKIEEAMTGEVCTPKK